MFSTPRAIQSTCTFVNLKFRSNHIQRIHWLGIYKALNNVQTWFSWTFLQWLNPVIEHKWNVFRCNIIHNLFLYGNGVCQNGIRCDSITEPTSTRRHWHLFHAYTLMVYICRQWKHPLQYFEYADVYHISIHSNQDANVASQRSKWTIFMGNFFLSLFRQLQSYCRLLYGFDFKWSVSK